MHRVFCNKENYSTRMEWLVTSTATTLSYYAKQNKGTLSMLFITSICMMHGYVLYFSQFGGFSSPMALKYCFPHAYGLKVKSLSGSHEHL